MASKENEKGISTWWDNATVGKLPMEEGRNLVESPRGQIEIQQVERPDIRVYTTATAMQDGRVV